MTMLFIVLLSSEAHRLETKAEDSRTLLRDSIVAQNESPWAHLYASKCDRAFIKYTGVNVATFERLLLAFTPLYSMTTPYNRGGQYFRRLNIPRTSRTVFAADGLALALRWCGSQCSHDMLVPFFGMLPTMISTYLPYCLSLWLIVLKNDRAAHIGFPSAREQQLLACMVVHKYPLLKGCIGAIDGLRLPVTDSADEMLQERYYNGWHSEHCTNNVLVWLADGTIAAAGMNYWGTNHDSTTALESGIYHSLTQHLTRGLYIAGDCAFPSINRKIRRVSKANEGGAQSPHELAWEKSLTALRQCSEWGNNELCRVFPRLKTKWDINNSAFRQLGMMTIVHLHNLRTRLLGRNEIRSVFYTPFVEEFCEQ